MIKWALVPAACFAAALLAGCAEASAPAAPSPTPPVPKANPTPAAQPGSAQPTRATGGGLGLLGSTFTYDSTRASATCLAGVGTVTATETWTSSGRGIHLIEVAGKRKTYATSTATGHETATFTPLKPGQYYVTFSSTDGAAAREKVAVCG